MGLELLSNEAARSFLGEGVAAEDGVLGSEEIAVDSEGTLRTLHCFINVDVITLVASMFLPYAS